MMLSIRLAELINEKKNERIILAKQCAVTYSAVSSWINGTTKPTLENLITIAKYFNVTTDYLLGLTDSIDVPFGTNDVITVPDYCRELINVCKTMSREKVEDVIKFAKFTKNDK